MSRPNSAALSGAEFSHVNPMHTAIEMSPNKQQKGKATGNIGAPVKEEINTELAKIVGPGPDGDPEKAIVYVSLDAEITKISDVDETFNAYGVLHFAVYNFGEDEEHVHYEDVKDFIPFRLDLAMFDNAQDNECADHCIEIKREDDWLEGHISFEAVFEDQSDVHRFPFDRQSLHISVKFNKFIFCTEKVFNELKKHREEKHLEHHARKSTGHHMKKIKEDAKSLHRPEFKQFIVHYADQCRLKISSGVILNEWRLQKHLHCGLEYKMTAENDEHEVKAEGGAEDESENRSWWESLCNKRKDEEVEKKVKSFEVKSFDIHFRMERNSSFYITQVVTPLFLIVSLGLGAMVIDVASPSDRFSVILTLLLTAVAFKYIVAAYLPKVPYSTYMDKYVLFSFALLFISAIESAIAAYVANKACDKHQDFPGVEAEYDETCWVIIADQWFWIVCYAPYFLVHILWLLVCCRDDCFRQRWDEVEKAEERMMMMEENAEAENFIIEKKDKYMGRGNKAKYSERPPDENDEIMEINHARSDNKKNR